MLSNGPSPLPGMWNGKRCWRPCAGWPKQCHGGFFMEMSSLKSKSFQCHRLQRKMLLG